MADKPKLKLTAEQLADYTRYEQERLELDRKSRTLARSQAVLSEHFKAFLDQEGKDTATRGGFRVSIIDGTPAISWKEELLAVVGPLRVEEITRAAPIRKRLVVDPPKAEPAAARKAA